MKSLAAALLFIAPLTSFGQTPSGSTQVADSPKVTVTSRGNDVRLILTNMFSQAKKSFILQPNIEYSLYLSLQDTDFQKALDLICVQANLKYDIHDDVYHIFKKKAIAPVATPTTRLPDSSNTLPAATDLKPESISVKKTGKLPLSIFKKKVTTRLAKAPIGAVLEELGTQAGVTIELGDNVPAYRLDAFLNGTTLRYALEQVTRAAKLSYTLTDHRTILVDSRN